MDRGGGRVRGGEGMGVYGRVRECHESVGGWNAAALSR